MRACQINSSSSARRKTARRRVSMRTSASGGRGRWGRGGREGAGLVRRRGRVRVLEGMQGKRVRTRSRREHAGATARPQTTLRAVPARPAATAPCTHRHVLPLLRRPRTTPSPPTRRAQAPLRPEIRSNLRRKPHQHTNAGITGKSTYRNHAPSVSGSAAAVHTPRSRPRGPGGRHTTLYSLSRFHFHFRSSRWRRMGLEIPRAGAMSAGRYSGTT
ncbi:hypothetical protein DFH06DRAFT_140258 [Mycena polygramma]|nr:hypothetical protein DFH06DRAFT_140258 [Mycena polygramma]